MQLGIRPETGSKGGNLMKAMLYKKQDWIDDANKSKTKRLENSDNRVKLSQFLKECTTEQIYGKYANDKGQACAVGAMGQFSHSIREDGKISPQLFCDVFSIEAEEFHRSVDCHLCNQKGSIDEEGYYFTLFGMIIHLNDIHKKTFKEIGEWLEKFGL